MTIRSVAYWSISIALAAVASHAAETGVAVVDAPVTASLDLTALTAAEPARGALLAAGVIAMAFTYRRAWANLKRGSIG